MNIMFKYINTGRNFVHIYTPIIYNLLILFFRNNSIAHKYHPYCYIAAVIFNGVCHNNICINYKTIFQWVICNSNAIVESFASLKGLGFFCVVPLRSLLACLCSNITLEIKDTYLVSHHLWGHQRKKFPLDLNM